MTTTFDTILFDLDGTLCDTAPDLLTILNRALQEAGRPPITLEKMRCRISEGVKGMVHAGFGEVDDDYYWQLRKKMMNDYATLSPLEADLFPGMADVLAHIEKSGLQWGIVTNKPTVHSHALLHHLQLMDRAGSVVCADTLPVRKPAPEPLWHACKEMGAKPERTLFIGDSIHDMQAGKAAGIVTLCAMYGYMLNAEETADWPCNGRINRPVDILSYIN